jgi:hypothetical protein
VNDTRQIESPDHLELIRTGCRSCAYRIAVAIWCHDPACCNQSPWEFLVEELMAAQAHRGFPVFAARGPDPLPPYSPDIPTRVWRAGNVKPVFEGRHRDAMRFTVRHDCPTPSR